MKRCTLLGLLWLATCGLGSAQADEGALRSLGELNGIALACKQSALVARARDAVIDIAPKERAIGEAFEQATSESYLASMQSGRSCPDGRTLADRMAAAIASLRAAYPLAR